MIKFTKLDLDWDTLISERTDDMGFKTGVLEDNTPEFFMYKPIGVESASRLIGQANRVLVYYDPDVDGLLAGEMASNFCRITGKKYFQFVNSDRKHGFEKRVISTCKKNRIDLCLCVDFTIEADYIDRLNKENIKVVCIDHHIPQDILKEKDLYTLINNQYKQDDVPDSIVTLSGAGVVYYALYWILKGMGFEKEAKQWIESIENKIWVGITLLSDSRDIENEVCRYFLYTTYKYWNDSEHVEFILSFKTNDYVFGLPKIERNFIDFEFSPVINSLFRFNKGLEIIRAFNEKEITSELLGYKQKQRKLVDYLYQHTDYRVYEKIVRGLLNVNSLKHEEELGISANIDNFVGLIASRAKEYYRNTAWVISDSNKDLKRGSVRGIDSNFDYLSIFRQYTIANGHKMAFGTYSSKFIDVAKLNEDLTKYDKKVINYPNFETTNLRTFLMQHDVKKMAYINMYLKNDRQILIEYKGRSATLKCKRGIAEEYLVDGVSATAFTSDFKYVHPILTSGYLQLVLE